MQTLNHTGDCHNKKPNNKCRFDIGFFALNLNRHYHASIAVVKQITTDPSTQSRRQTRFHKLSFSRPRRNWIE